MSTDVKSELNRAIQFHQSGELIEAEKIYTEILNIDCDNASSLNLLGLLNLQKKQFEEAIFYIQKAVEITPCGYFYESLGRAYYGNNNFDKAIESYKKSLDLAPNDFDAYFNLALVYKKCEQTDNAIKAYQKALSIKPDSVDVFVNLANIYESKNETNEALKYYKKAHEQCPNDEAIKYFLALSYLKMKKFKEGWRLYEGRECKQLSIFTQELQYKDLITSKPIWQGEAIDNQTVLIYYEAGLGDTILFARYLPLLKSKCKNVLFMPQPCFTELFRENNLGAEIIESKDLTKDIVFDVHTPIMSLPYLLQQNEEDPPFADSYLSANPEKVQTYKDKYFDNNKLKIGIKWKGNTAYGLERIVSLDLFYKLFDLPNTQFYSLQKGEGVEELNDIPEKYNVIDLGATFKDFSETSAAIENLDLVICNDTSVAHLAGAMGKKCLILLPFVPNWRWQADMSSSPWYKSAKLLKQRKAENWDSVFEEIKNELSAIS